MFYIMKFNNPMSLTGRNVSYKKDQCNAIQCIIPHVYLKFLIPYLEGPSENVDWLQQYSDFWIVPSAARLAFSFLL